MNQQTPRKPQNDAINHFVNKINNEMTWADDTVDLDYCYKFNRQFFESSQEIYGGYNGKYLIQTSLVLPFYIPIDNSPISVGLHVTDEEAGFATFIFTCFEEQRRFLGGLLPEYGITYQSKRTRCEVTFLLRSEVLTNTDHEIRFMSSAKTVRASKTDTAIDGEMFMNATRDVFASFSLVVESGIRYLNSFILGFAHHTGDDAVCVIDENMVEHVSHFRIIELDPWTTYNWMHMHNINFPQADFDQLPPDDIGQVFRNSIQFHKSDFRPFFQYAQRARYELQLGSSMNSIIYSVVSIEVLLSTIVRLYYQHIKRKSVSEATQFLSRLHFKHLFTTEIPKILGGSWTAVGTKKVPEKWYNGAYESRNRIVHAGIEVDQSTIFEASQQSFELVQYVKELVLKNSKKYPFLMDLVSLPSAKIVSVEYGVKT